MRVVASMIVRNELGRYLDLAVERLLRWCSEVRVLDDGSDDGTFEWCEEQPGVEVKRNPGQGFYEYESRARNELLAWTMEARPDYVLAIDADEFVGDPTRILNILEAQNPVVSLGMVEVFAASARSLSLREDGQWGRRHCPILWRAPPSLLPRIWRIPDRKLSCGREPLAVRRAQARRSGSDVLHFGWARRAEREARHHRYAVHDRGRFHRDAHLASILNRDDDMTLTPARWPADLVPIREQLLARVNR